MVHIMLTSQQQLDMRHLVLLPCMTILDQYQDLLFQVSAFTSYRAYCTLIILSYAIFIYLFESCRVGLGGESARGLGKKIFVGRLPQEATAEDLRQYFGRFGRIADVYVPRVR